MTAVAPDTFYGPGFAEFYDRYGTGWTRQFAPVLAEWLGAQGGAGGPDGARRTDGGGVAEVLDLACGTGVATGALQAAGWRVVGLDLSAGMLAVAAERLADAVRAGTVTFRQADAAAFALDRPVAAAVALEGALNHLPSAAALADSFARVAAALLPGGSFVFDLYEPHHFRGWHRVDVLDEDDAVVVKRGVWDEAGAVGMLRISGCVDTGAGLRRVRQTVTSRTWPAATVDDLLAAAGLQPGRFPGDVPSCGCGRSGTGACRTVYTARRPTA